MPFQVQNEHKELFIISLIFALDSITSTQLNWVNLLLLHIILSVVNVFCSALSISFAAKLSR